jgi:hypothetical protein
MSVYFVHLSGKAYGPYTVDQMRAMLVTGKLVTTTLIFEQGGPQQWLPLANFPHLMQQPKKNAKALAATPTVTSIPLNTGEIEKMVWEGRPSTWKIVGKIIKAVIFCVFLMVTYVLLKPNLSEQIGQILNYGFILIFIILIMRLLWEWINIKTIRWSLSNERITKHIGVFNRKMDSMELYRIKDLIINKPIFYRLLGIGFLTLITSDVTDTIMVIGPVPKPDDLYQIIRKYTERQRQRRGVREIDILKT